MRKRTHKISDVHSDWLTQVDVEGPFLAYPVLKDMWPNGVDRLGDSDDRLLTFKQAFVQWQRAFDHYVEQPKTPESKVAYDVVRRAWIDVVLDDIAEWNGLRVDSELTVRSPGEQITVTATGALEGRDGDTAALLLVCDPTPGLRDAGLDGWAANDVDRMSRARAAHLGLPNHPARGQRGVRDDAHAARAGDGAAFHALVRCQLPGEYRVQRAPGPGAF